MLCARVADMVVVVCVCACVCVVVVVVACARTCVCARAGACVCVCAWVLVLCGCGGGGGWGWGLRPHTRGRGAPCAVALVVCGVREGVRGGSRLVARVKQVVPAAGLLPPSHWLTCRWARVGSIFALSGHCAVHRVVRVCVPRSHRSCSCLAATRRRRVAAVQLPRCPRACRVAMAVWRWWWWCGRGGVARAHRVTAARRFFEHAAWSAHLTPSAISATQCRAVCARVQQWPATTVLARCSWCQQHAHWRLTATAHQ